MCSETLLLGGVMMDHIALASASMPSLAGKINGMPMNVVGCDCSSRNNCCTNLLRDSQTTVPQ